MVEGSEVSFVCPICGESDFSEKGIFPWHLKTHELNNFKIGKCISALIIFNTPLGFEDFLNMM